MRVGKRFPAGRRKAAVLHPGSARYCLGRMGAVAGLRSSYDRVGGLVHFGRMIDKIRLRAAGRLPEDYHNNLGGGFDGTLCTFLKVDYAALTARVAAGGTDEELLAWCQQQGGRDPADYRYFNAFLAKRGWRDEASERLQQRIVEYGLAGRPIETFFDLNDYDEGRDPVAERAWER
jgi:hypothetical protein